MGSVSDTAAYSEAIERRRKRLTISGTPVLTGDVGVAYAGFTVAAANGRGGNVFAVASGALPDGLTLDAETGAVAGTPTQAGSFTAEIGVTDASLHLDVLDAFTIVIS